MKEKRKQRRAGYSQWPLGVIMKSIKIKGITSCIELEDYFASRLVDIAYIDRCENGEATITLDVGIDLEVKEDRNWLMDLHQQALDECNEDQSKIEIFEGL